MKLTQQLRNALRVLLPGVLALSSLSFAPHAAAQSPQAAPQTAPAAMATRIDGFDVEPVTQATAGSELLFTLYGSPGGQARVQITGATGQALLEELEPGLYEGVYTVRSRDRIAAASSVTVNLRNGNQVATAMLDESLIGQPRSRRPIPSSNSVRVDRFGLEQPPSLAAGNELRFNATGTPDAVASVRIAGVRGKVNLREVRRGVYRGAYVIKNRDRLDGNTAVSVYLRQGAQETALVGQTLGFAVQQNAAIQPVVPAAAARPPVCNLCGTVQAVNEVKVQGDGSLVGKVGGGVVGAILGSQVGKGDGRKAAQVVGAIGGAVAGNEIEKRVKATTHYEVVVKLDNGGSQTVSYAQPPNLPVGSRVKIESNGTLSPV